MMDTNRDGGRAKGTTHPLLPLNNNNNTGNNVSNNNNNNNGIDGGISPTAHRPQKLVLPNGAGRAVPRTILRPPTNIKSKTLVTEPRPVRPLNTEQFPIPHSTAAAAVSFSPPPRFPNVPSVVREDKTDVPRKGALVTSTSTNKTRLIQGNVKSTLTPTPPKLSSPSSLALPVPPTVGTTVSASPSIFDEAPVETSLEYLTRPHRSWDSAVRTRELRMRKVEERTRIATSRYASTSLTNSRQSSTITSPTSERSLSRISFNSAPPTFGRAITMTPSLGGSSSSGVIRRGRLGMLPNARTEVDNLSVGGSRIDSTTALTAGVEFPTRLSTRQKPVPLGRTPASVSVGSSTYFEARGNKGTAHGRGMREFFFSME